MLFAEINLASRSSIPTIITENDKPIFLLSKKLIKAYKNTDIANVTATVLKATVKTNPNLLIPIETR